MASVQRADLVLSGGGVKGIGLVGAVAALADAGYAPQRVSGTSAGALVGAILAAAAQRGVVTADQLRALAMQIDYRAVLDQGPVQRIPLLGPAVGVLTGDGIYRGDALHDWVEEQLAEYGVSTFADLALPDRGLPPEQRYRLVVTVADVTMGQLIRLPGLPACTGSIPTGSGSVRFGRPQPSRSSIGRPPWWPPMGKSTLVDGGLLSNYPIDSLNRPRGSRAGRRSASPCCPICRPRTSS
jgi:NTE family protein